MLLLVVFAFVAGIVTILSPCILPILPIILTGTIGGDKKPYGIVLGFVLSFTFFTLFLTSLVKLTNISPDFLRNFAITALLIFGCGLLIPKVQIFLEILFSKLANFIPQNNQQNTGFFSGIFVGITIGLLWTPCVGPILASVISLALAGTVTGSAIAITFAYALGTAIPMLAITIGGRNLLQKVPWLLANSGNIQKGFGVIMIITAIALFFNFDRNFQTFILAKFPQYGTGLTKIEDNQIVQKQLGQVERSPQESDLQSLGKAANFIPGGEWFNSKPLNLQDLKGKVVLVDFWTYTCINCIRTLPYLKDWNEKYRDKGLVIIGVHTPEFEFEKNPQNVQKAIKDFGIQYPVMQDNNYATWGAYDNHYWPAHYLIDKDGNIRQTHFGEGKYDETEKAIQELLAETGQQVENMPINNPTYQINSMSPETYLGYGRMEYLTPSQTITPNQPQNFILPKTLGNNTFAFGGDWTIGPEYAIPNPLGILEINFNSQNVFLVMRPSQSSSQAKVFLDGKIIPNNLAGSDVKNGIVTINEDRLYNLVKLPKIGNHLLRLEFIDQNPEVFAFTFG